MLLFYELHVEQLMNPDGHTMRITDPRIQNAICPHHNDPLRSFISVPQQVGVFVDHQCG